MNRLIKISKGIDLPVAGEVPDAAEVVSRPPSEVAVVPDDFHGFLPKLLVKEGDMVSAGSPLLYDKRDESMVIVSPCCGTVRSIVRGERRHIERIVITPSDKNAAPSTAGDTAGAAAGNGLAVAVSATVSREEVKEYLKKTGLWVLMRQRPYDIVPEPDCEPRDIFVTAFDSSPLAVPYGFDAGCAAAGVALLARITPGKVWVSRRLSAIPDIPGAEMVDVTGPHPSGNVGVQIAAVAPVSKGEQVITLSLDVLCRIGRAVLTGHFDGSARVALCGPEVRNPRMVETLMGADIRSVVGGDIADDGRHHRIISGNVLTGCNVGSDGYLRFPYTQVTVIAEGDDVEEFMGWASLSPRKMSCNRSFPSGLLGKFFRRRFSPDARLLGGRRALIMSEEYDRYMPMDIMAEYLLKAIMGRDIEKMEQLGIYEVAPEDFALGEYADTSKLEAQRIVREGLDYLRKELS